MLNMLKQTREDNSIAVDPAERWVGIETAEVQHLRVLLCKRLDRWGDMCRTSQEVVSSCVIDA